MNVFMYVAFWVFFFLTLFIRWIPRNIIWSKGINMPFECILPNCFPKGINWPLFPSFWFYKLQFTLLPNKCLLWLALTMLQTSWEDSNRGEKLVCKYISAVQVLMKAQGTWELRGRAPASLVEKLFSVTRESRLCSLIESHAFLDPQLTEASLAKKSCTVWLMICYPKEKGPNVICKLRGFITSVGLFTDVFSVISPS